MNVVINTLKVAKNNKVHNMYNTNVQDKSERMFDNDAFQNGWIVPKTVEGLIKTQEEFDDEDAYDKGWVIPETVEGLVKTNEEFDDQEEVIVWKPSNKQVEVIVWKN